MGFESRAVRVGRGVFHARSRKLEWLFDLDLAPPYQARIDGYRLDQLVIVGFGNPFMAVRPCPFDAEGVGNRDLQPVDGPSGASAADHRCQPPKRLTLGEHEQRSDWIAARVVEITHLDQPTATVAADAVVEPRLVDQLLSNNNVTPILVAGELPHQREHGGIDLERYALDRTHRPRMQLNRDMLAVFGVRRPCRLKSFGFSPEIVGASALAGSKSRLSCFLECSLDRLYGLGIAGLDESSADVSRAFHPPRRPRQGLCKLRLVERMIKKDFLGELVQRCLMVGMETGKATFVGVEAGHLRDSIQQPIPDLGALSTGPVNATKFQLPKGGMFVAGRLHILLGPQETGEFKFVPHRVTKLKAKQHVGVLDPALPVLLAPILALVPAEMDLIEDGAQRHEGELLVVEATKDLLQPPRGCPLGQIVGKGPNPELQGLTADLLNAIGCLLDLGPGSGLGVENRPLL